MKLYSTTDIEASIRKSASDFTHVIFSRGYTLLKPVFFNTAKIKDIPAWQYASWIPATAGQIDKWKANGGLLIEQDTLPQVELRPDVTVLVECPYEMRRVERCNERNAEYGVIPHPMNWRTHEECLDIRFPHIDVLEPLWRLCAAQQMTNVDLSSASGIPTTVVQYMKNVFKPKEHWYVQKRLAPERDELVLAWDWLKAGTTPKQEISESGFKAQIEELAKFGYIQLKKVFHYPTEEPDWRKLQQKRDDTLSDLAAVRSLVESLPDHLE